MSADESGVKVSPSSDLAGYHYETELGRHATFFWQATSTAIYASPFLRMDTTWASLGDPVLVASSAKRNTPIAAAAIYYLDGLNNICERVTSNSGETWEDGALTALSVPARTHSDLNAAILCPKFNEFVISLYFQDEQNFIRELRYPVKDAHWHEDDEVKGYKELQALEGSTVGCLYAKGYINIIILTTEKRVQQFWHYRPNSTGLIWSTGPTYKDAFNQTFPRTTRFRCTNPNPGDGRYYAYENGTVLERDYRSTRTLPTDDGNPK